MEKELEKLDQIEEKIEREDEEPSRYIKVEKNYIFDLFDNKKNKIELDSLEINEMKEDELSVYKNIENKKNSKVEDKGIPIQGFKIRFKTKNIINEDEEEDYKNLELIIFCISKNQRLYKVILFDDKDVIETDVVKAYSTSNIESLIKEVIKKYFKPEYTLEEEMELNKEKEEYLEEYEEEIEIDELIKEMGLDEEEDDEYVEENEMGINEEIENYEKIKEDDLLKEGDDKFYEENEYDVIMDEEFYEEIKNDFPELKEWQIRKITDKISRKLNEDVENYLEYIAEKWIRKNVKSIKESVEYQKYKEIVDSIIGALTENYIVIKPIEKDREKEMIEIIKERDREIKKLNEENCELYKKYKELLKDKILIEETIGLSEYKRNKIKRLLENKSYKNLLEYKEDINKIKKELLEERRINKEDEIRNNKEILTESDIYTKELYKKETDISKILEELNNIYKGI